jgi:putative MATE family efflux protein
MPADTKTHRILHGSIPLVLARLSIPNVAVMVTQSSVGLVEVYFLSKLGTEKLAGVSQVFPILALVTAISQGAVGGGIVSTIARKLGQKDYEAANRLAWHAVYIGLGLGLLTTALLTILSSRFYVAMGAHGEALQVANSYSTVIFGGALLIWLFNTMMSVVRATGNTVLPLYVVCGGAILLLPLSPLLIFGAGPLPGLGVIGGAIAILIYYASGTVIYATYIWRGKSVIRPSFTPVKASLTWTLGILRVGGLSAIVSATTNLTLAIITGYVGFHGNSALAGYGAGARLELLLVPLSYGIGGPAGIFIATNLGAGSAHRARVAGWAAVISCAAVAEAIGLSATFWPSRWLGLFTNDPAALETGVLYLHTTGPFFGFFGAAFAIYCVAQALGHLRWPVTGALLRAAIAVAGGWFASSLINVFYSVAAGMTVFFVLAVPLMFNSRRWVVTLARPK